MSDLYNRTDNIIASYNTFQNSELLDIRGGLHGEPYRSAGESLRGQISNVEYNIAKDYNEQNVYKIGDLVIYDGSIYQCRINMAIEAGEFNYNYWYGPLHLTSLIKRAMHSLSPSIFSNLSSYKLSSPYAGKQDISFNTIHSIFDLPSDVNVKIPLTITSDNVSGLPIYGVYGVFTNITINSDLSLLLYYTVTEKRIWYIFYSSNSYYNDISENWTEVTDTSIIDYNGEEPIEPESIFNYPQNTNILITPNVNKKKIKDLPTYGNNSYGSYVSLVNGEFLYLIYFGNDNNREKVWYYVTSIGEINSIEWIEVGLPNIDFHNIHSVYDFPPNTNIQIHSNITSNDIAGLPIYGTYGIFTSISFENIDTLSLLLYFGGGARAERIWYAFIRSDDRTNNIVNWIEVYSKSNKNEINNNLFINAPFIDGKSVHWNKNTYVVTNGKNSGSLVQGSVYNNSITTDLISIEPGSVIKYTGKTTNEESGYTEYLYEDVTTIIEGPNNTTTTEITNEITYQANIRTRSCFIVYYDKDKNFIARNNLISSQGSVLHKNYLINRDISIAPQNTAYIRVVYAYLSQFKNVDIYNDGEDEYSIFFKNTYPNAKSLNFENNNDYIKALNEFNLEITPPILNPHKPGQIFNINLSNPNEYNELLNYDTSKIKSNGYRLKRVIDNNEPSSGNEPSEPIYDPIDNSDPIDEPIYDPIDEPSDEPSNDPEPSSNNNPIDTWASNRVIINRSIVCDDVSYTAYIVLKDLDSICTLGTETLFDNEKHATIVIFDFKNKKVRLMGSTDDSGGYDGKDIYNIDFNRVNGNGEPEIDESNQYKIIGMENVSGGSYRIEIGRQNRCPYVKVYNLLKHKICAKYVAYDYLTSKGYGGKCGSLYDIPNFGVIQGDVIFRKVNATVPYGKFAVFVGDSITEGSKVSFEDTWTNKCIKCLESGLNCGRGGGKIAHALKIIKDIVPAVKPQYVIVTIGTNDPEITAEKYIEIINEIKKYNSIPIINCIPVKVNSNIKPKNVIIVSLKIDGARFDRATSLNHDIINGNTDLFIPNDDTHPNALGHQAMFEQFFADLGWIKNDDKYYSLYSDIKDINYGYLKLSIHKIIDNSNYILTDNDKIIFIIKDSNNQTVITKELRLQHYKGNATYEYPLNFNDASILHDLNTNHSYNIIIKIYEGNELIYSDIASNNIENKVYIEDLNAEEWCDIHKKYE